MRRGALVVLLLFGCVAAYGEPVTLFPTQTDVCTARARAAGWRSFATIVKYLRGLHDAGSRMGRFDYEGDAHGCYADIHGSVPFPELDVASPSKRVIGVAAMREMFRNDVDITVREGSSGMPRTTIGAVPDSILQTKFSSITLNAREQYNPLLAIQAVLGAKEVGDATRSQGYRIPVRLIDMLIAPSLTRLPHLPRVMTDMTLDHALDSVAKTFNGVVLFGVSPRTREISADFVWI